MRSSCGGSIAPGVGCACILRCHASAFELDLYIQNGLAHVLSCDNCDLIGKSLDDGAISDVQKDCARFQVLRNRVAAGQNGITV